MQRLFLAIFAFLTTIFVVTPVFALQKSGDTVTLLPTETVNEDYFASGNLVTISGTVNGDAFLGAGNIVVDGTINGDLLAAGGNIDIRGKVTGDIRAAGGQINVSGNVGRNLSVAGGSINLASNAQIAGNLTAAGGSVSVSSPIAGGITAGVGQMIISNRVGKDINAAGQISLAPTANIAGNLTYWNTNPAQISPGATVSGQITQNQPPGEKKVEPAGFLAALAAFQIWMTLAFLVTYLVIGLLLLHFTPLFLRETAGQIEKRPWASLGIGFLALLVTPLIIFTLMITLLGIPLALALLLLYILAIFLSKIFISLTLGKKILNIFTKEARDGWALLLGIIIYLILAGIPILGGLVILVATSFGLGALLLSLKTQSS